MRLSKAKISDSAKNISNKTSNFVKEKTTDNWENRKLKSEDEAGWVTKLGINQAKKVGFKSKKPKKPKASATLNAFESYIVRYNEFVKRLKEKAQMFDKKEADKKKREVLRKKVAAL
jgi:hypothetical protein